MNLRTWFDASPDYEPPPVVGGVPGIQAAIAEANRQIDELDFSDQSAANQQLNNLMYERHLLMLSMED
ncbi:MAG: hypothetical protein KC441_02470 [Anaerolineales bacterium]|nr:hypothetical protein [Anaerolineales bacterium]